METILAYVDLLGFTKMIEKDHQKSEALLLRFYDIAFNSINDDNRLKGNISSDCLLVYSTNYPDSADLQSVPATIRHKIKKAII